MRRRRRSSRRTTRTTTAPRSSRARHVRRAAPRSPASPSTRTGRSPTPTTARSSSPTTPVTASGSCSRARTASRPGRIGRLQAAAANPVDLQIGPDGELYYADFDGGTIRRIAYLRESAANCVARPDPDERNCAADRQLRRKRLERPRGRAAELLMGSQRGWNVRRLHRSSAYAHLHPGGHLQREAARD